MDALTIMTVADNHADHLRVIAFDYADGRTGYLALVRESFAEADAATLRAALSVGGKKFGDDTQSGLAHGSGSLPAFR